MALTPEEINRINEEFDQLIKQLDEIDQRSLNRTKENLLTGKINLVEWNREIKRFKTTVDGVANSLSYVATSFRDSVNELQKQNKYLSSSKSIINNISKSAQEALSVRRGEVDINVKSISQAKQNIASQREQLEIARKNGNLTLEQRLEIFKATKDLDDYEAGLQGVLNTNKQINEELGLAPQILGGIDKQLQKLGFPTLGVGEALNETRRLGQEAAFSGKEFSAIGKFTSIIGTNLKGLVSTANILAASIGFLVDALISTDKSSGELAKNLGISYDESLAMVSSMTDIANLSMDTFVTTEGLVKAQQALSSALGTNVQLSSDLLVDFTKLTEQAGYSAEAATTLGKVSLATGKPVKDITTQFLGQAKALNLQNDLALNEKQLLESVAKTSKGTLATFASQPKKLAEAVFQAKKLGLEMSQLESMADGLLDIESSLTAEFEAEVITGKQLNLERARFFALTNDIAGVGREIEKQGYSQQQFAEATRIEQDAMAKAMGLSRDELGNMLITSEALRNTGAKNEEDLRKQYEAVRGTAEEQAFLNKLGSDQYAQQLKSQSVQERFNKTVAKLQDIFVSIAEPVLAIVSPFADLVNTVMPALNLAIIPIKAVFEGISFIVQGIANGVRQLTGFLKENLDVATVLLGTYTTISAIKNRELITTQATAAVEAIKNARAKAGAVIQTTINAIKNKGLLKTIAEAAMSAFSSIAKIPFVGPALGAAAAAAAYMLGKSYMSKGDDVMSPGGGGYGSRTLMGPEGSIALNNKDTVIAGTNLFPKDKSSERNAPTNVTVTLSQSDIKAIASAVREGASQATINLDGDRVSSRLQTPMITNTLPGV